MPTWSERGLASAKAHLGRISGLMPQWYDLDAATGRIALESEVRQQQVQEYLSSAAPELALMPLVGDGGNPAALATILSVPATRTTFVREVTAIAAASTYDGLCVDFSGLLETSEDDVLLTLTEMRLTAGMANVRTCAVVSIAEYDWPLERISALTDRLILVTFREPGPDNGPGAIVPQRTFTEAVTAAISRVDPSKTVVALGTTGFEWIAGEAMPHPIEYPAAMRLAALHDATITFDPVSLNTTFSFVDDAGLRHTVWLLDAVAAYNQLLTLQQLNVPNIAIWPVGGEDPGIWSLLGDQGLPGLNAAARLAPISLDEWVGYEGTGVFLRVIGTPLRGLRLLEQDADTGLLVKQRYTAIPEGYTIGRWGVPRPGQIALTFDDGPDGKYTAEILDVLKAEGIPATFFVTGANALEHGGLLRRMVDEGHEIGNHTYAHSNIAAISDDALRLEVNATQRAIIANTGYKTLLFRPPYNEDAEPAVGSEARPITQLSALGYLNVGIELDPHDWRGQSASEIVASVVKSAGEGGSVLVLHDAGGDRSPTVEALPEIIAELRAAGFTFVSLADLLGTTRAEIMPPDDIYDYLIDASLLNLILFLQDAVIVAFALAVILGVLRAILMVLFALRRKHHAAPGDFAPPVTVLVPAFCEEDVIVESIESLLASHYKNLRVLVVDDGSTDRTYQIVKRVYANHPRVRVVTQRNEGKASALNHGYRIAETAIVVAVDADTRLAPDAIGLMVRHFADRTVGAVAGNVKVVNRRKLLPRMQSIEYIIGQNLERRAMETVNAINVVPGAIGAWRKDAVISAGGLSTRTLAEDADLTFAIQRAGYRVVYEEDAIALTQAPEKLGQFIRQRFRWIFGMLQTAWFHRRALSARQPIGIFGVGNVLLFGTILPLVAPFVDLVFIW